jgi:uncharacterized damage-inducible protein DinB
MTINAIREEYARYRDLGRRAIDQASDAGLNQVYGEHHSIGVNVRHLHAVLIARLSDFLTSDGDKPWRRRDEEFVRSFYPRGELVRLYEEAWAVADDTLGALSDADLATEVRFRSQTTRADLALWSLAAHIAYHVGQIVLLARQAPAKEWKPVSVPVRSAAKTAAGH